MSPDPRCLLLNRARRAGWTASLRWGDRPLMPVGPCRTRRFAKRFAPVETRVPADGRAERGRVRRGIARSSPSLGQDTTVLSYTPRSSSCGVCVWSLLLQKTSCYRAHLFCPRRRRLFLVLRSRQHRASLVLRQHPPVDLASVPHSSPQALHLCTQTRRGIVRMVRNDRELLVRRYQYSDNGTVTLRCSVPRI